MSRDQGLQGRNDGMVGERTLQYSMIPLVQSYIPPLCPLRYQIARVHLDACDGDSGGVHVGNR